MKKIVSAISLVFVTACGAGVPVQIRIDELEIPLSLDDALKDVGPAVLPPGSTGLPEIWPPELPDVCFDVFVATDPDLGGRIDLTPDPVKDPENYERFKPVNEGLVSRIEIDELVMRVEANNLNVPLPVIQVQAADAIDADPRDRRAWRTIGTLGGAQLPPPCSAPRPMSGEGIAVNPGELADVPFEFSPSGESYLNAQFADESCTEPTRCKELSLRARTRLRLDTRDTRERPHGAVQLRLIVVATFFVTPI